VGAPLGAAVNLPGHFHTAGTIVGEPVQSLFIGSSCHHHLEHRPGTERAEGAVNKRGIVRLNAFGYIEGIVFRHTDTGQYLAGIAIHDHNAAPRHIQ